MDTAVDTTSRSRRTLDPKPIAPSLFAHFVLRSSNAAAMVDWYTAVLNMRVVYRDDLLSFLTYDNEHHRLAIINIGGLHAPDDKSTGLSHVAYAFPRIGDLLATYRRLKAKGIEPYWPIHHGPTLSLYYHDPDGNSVELQVDCFSKAKAAAYFETEAFRKNPVGVVFDPEALASAYEAGTLEADLLRQPDGPPARV
ncbi:MAG: VOC family protein [Reyranella sp.]|nr:VOC family protein [Reyranella sp.]